MMIYLRTEMVSGGSSILWSIYAESKQVDTRWLAPFDPRLFIYSFKKINFIILNLSMNFISSGRMIIALNYDIIYRYL